jgi:hypothetical protein
MLYDRNSDEIAHDVVITGPVRFRAKNSARCRLDFGQTYDKRVTALARLGPLERVIWQFRNVAKLLKCPNNSTSVAKRLL